MSDRKIRVLVVDDSALLRRLLSDAVNADARMEVVGVARDGVDAIEKVRKLKPDVVTLDILMPRQDGLTTLQTILEEQPTPIVMVSSLTEQAADVTLQALEYGAMDYMAKPIRLKAIDDTFRTQLVAKLLNAASMNVQRVMRIRQSRNQRRQNAGQRTFDLQATFGDGSQRDGGALYQDGCIAIGISTGGPPALTRLFRMLKPPMPPILVVQHMPPDFTGPFAKRLNSVSRLDVKEAQSCDIVRANQAYIAPGGQHLRLVRAGDSVRIRIVCTAPVSGHRPSVDVMMQDVARCFRSKCLGVLMTGMGYDGAEGCHAIRDAGGFVFGQDEATSDVYGMNKVAFTKGHVDRQVALDDIPLALQRQCTKMFRLAPKDPLGTPGTPAVSTSMPSFK